MIVSIRFTQAELNILINALKGLELAQASSLLVHVVDPSFMHRAQTMVRTLREKLEQAAEGREGL